MSAYVFVIGVCTIVILSFLFSYISRKTDIPSVLMLIGLGIGIQQGLKYLGIEPQYFNTLEVLGIVGLIMIVLEAALDLELKREKWPIIWKSFLISFLLLFSSSLLIAFIIQLFIQNVDYVTALIYAIPFSIMSSAIIIPSVANMPSHKREFMIYESTFSDILGIMFFYFLIENINAHGVGEVVLSLSGNIVITILISVVLSYVMLYIVQKIKAETRFFLFLSVLVLLYAVGKMMHLSSLLIILMFGLLLRNYRVLLFPGMKKKLNEQVIDGLFEHFKMITIETSFLVRTLFFVVFGISMSLESLVSQRVWMISVVFVLVLYILRFLVFWAVERKDIIPQIFLSPRGLISILLFFAIPEEFRVPDFESGALLLVIIFSSIIMALSLILQKRSGGVKKVD